MPSKIAAAGNDRQECLSHRAWRAVVVLCVIALGAALVMPGCSKSNKPRSVSIAVIPKGTAHIFWQSVHAGANRAARELGIDDPIWQGPAQENEAGRQIDIVNDMLAKNVSAIVLAPLDQKALARTVAQVHAKMPIVIFDSAIIGTDNYTAFIATDNEKGGRLAGEEMARLLGEQGGKVIMVPYGPESASTLAREKGFREAVKAHPKVTLIETAFANPNREQARRQALDALVTHADARGFFGSNESTAVGTLLALKERDLLAKVKEGKLFFLGFDSSEELADALAAGHCNALVLQDPVRMGYNSVKAAYAALKGETVPKNQPIEPTLITPMNMGQPRMKELLRPDLEKDLGKRR